MTSLLAAPFAAPLAAPFAAPIVAAENTRGVYEPASGVLQSGAWVLIALPALGAAVLLLGGRRTDRWGHLLGTVAALASFVCAASLFAAMVGRDPERRAVQERVSASAEYLAERMGEVPVLVLACIEAAAELPAENQAGLWGSLLPAAWSYQLAARARGLGSAWTTLHLPFEKEIAELLGIPPRVRQGVLLPTAYYTGETFRPAHREPLETVLHVNHW